ncbi:MAG: hypothetical protein JWQ57_3211, partial [Mucilaginibacter sp.]|nr:hypothetical protein [Mucilaginibacter sp.]
MEIICVTTHLVMTICIAIILNLSNKPLKTINKRGKLSARNRYEIR